MFLEPKLSDFTGRVVVEERAYTVDGRDESFGGLEGPPQGVVRPEYEAVDDRRA